MIREYRTRWGDDASCREAEDPEIFFEIENAVDEKRMADPMVISEAVHMCEKCPVIERCFREAVYTRSLGIWGGTTSLERGLTYRLARPEAS